ncbi:MAG: hypothetical protein V5A64_05290 [Candidatus Thermoplasmatota archaeon]
MKKILIAGLVAFCFLGLSGFASAETTFHSEWSGSGNLSEYFNAGDDADVWMKTKGNFIEGEFNAADKDNNPYSYGVDNVNANVDARVNNGGRISFEFDRTDSKESMYGPAGQKSYSYVSSDNGYAGMKYRSGSNFASMRNCEYKFNSNDQFFASGSNYEIRHTLWDSDDDGADVHVFGSSGNAAVTSMSEEAGGSSFEFGKGCGCYTNCGVEAVGSGSTTLFGTGFNYLKGDGWELPNGGSHTESWTYNDGISIGQSDFWMEGN